MAGKIMSLFTSFPPLCCCYVFTYLCNAGFGEGASWLSPAVTYITEEIRLHSTQRGSHPSAELATRKPLFGEAQSTYEWLALVGSKFRQEKMYIVERGGRTKEKDRKRNNLWGRVA
jgi:hypothetical protein